MSVSRKLTVDNKHVFVFEMVQNTFKVFVIWGHNFYAVQLHNTNIYDQLINAGKGMLQIHNIGQIIYLCYMGGGNNTSPWKLSIESGDA